MIASVDLIATDLLFTPLQSRNNPHHRKGIKGKIDDELVNILEAI